jgi:branched-chain amino acid transport system substrate-binding protein
MRKARVTRRTLIQTAGAAVGLAGTTLLGAPSVWGQNQSGKIKLVSVNSLSGGFARYGQELDRGIDIALERVNANGVKIGDRTYTIQKETVDDKSDATTLARLVEKAVTSDRANMVLAGLGSVLVKAAIPVAQRMQYPMMTHWAQVDGVFASQKPNPFMYGAMPPFSQYYTKISKMVAGFDNPKPKTVAMITPNDELGVFTARDYVPRDMKEAGLQLLGTEFFPPKTQEYTAALDRIRRMNPDVFIINCYTPEIIGVFKEMQSIKYFPSVIVVEAPTKLHESLGDGINGVFVPSFWDPTLDQTKDSVIGTSREFAALYKAKYKEEVPDFVAACGANNIVIYTQVMQAARSIDDVKAINQAFRALDGQTFFSETKFGDDGLNRKGGVYPAQFQKGRPELVYPAEVRTAEPIHPYPGYRKS